MNKIIFTLLAFVLSSGVLSAQNDDRDELLEYKNKEITDLKEKLAKKGSECDSLNKVIKELRKSADALNKDAKKVQEFKSEIKRLETDCDSLKDELKKLNKNHPAQKELEKLMAENNKLKELLSQQDSTINVNNSELKNLKAYKSQFIADLAKGADEKWLIISFEQLKVKEDTLKSDIELYAKFKDDDRSVKQAFDKLTALYADYQVYLAADSLLIKGGYSLAKVNELIGKAEAVVNATEQLVRKDEMTQKLNLLKIYTEGVNNFKYIISIINGSDDKDSEFIKLRIERRLSSEVEQLKQIPWLAEMFDAYLKQITENDNSVKDLTDPNNPETIAHQISILVSE